MSVKQLWCNFYVLDGEKYTTAKQPMKLDEKHDVWAKVSENFVLKKCNPFPCLNHSQLAYSHLTVTHIVSQHVPVNIYR